MILLNRRLAVLPWSQAPDRAEANRDELRRILGVQRVVAETMTVNAASRRVMEKAGLAYVRTFHQEWPERIEGDEYGDVEYALTRSDWERRQVAERGRL